MILTLASKSIAFFPYLVCTRDGTIIAKISKTTMERLKRDDTSLHHIIEKVLLQASLLELANIDVS